MIVRLQLLLVFITQIPLAPANLAWAQSKTTIAHAAITTHVAPLWIARDQGLFAKYGIDADVVAVRGAPILVAAITSGAVQVGYTGGSATLGAVAGGVDLKIIATFVNRVVVDLVVKPGVKTAEDLRGKSLGVQSIGGSSWMMAMLALEHLGLEPSRDNIRVVASGDNVVRSQALEAGSIDASISSDAAFLLRLKHKGYRALPGIPPLPIVSQSIVIQSSYLAKNADKLENVLRALLEGVAFVLSPKNKSIVLRSLNKRLAISDSANDEESYQHLLSTLDRKPYTTLEAFNNIHRLMKVHNPKVAKLRPDDVLENRFIRKLDESGFIDRLLMSYGVK